MKTINDQLNIGFVNHPRNTNIRPRYARASNMYQVQLGNEDPSLDYYNDIQSIKGYNNANGEYSNILGLTAIGLVAYPACIKLECKKCKNECKVEKGLKWRQGGKDCYKSCIVREKTAFDERIRGIQSQNNNTVDENTDTRNQENQRNNTSTIVAVGIGAVLLIGGIILLTRKNNK